MPFDEEEKEKDVWFLDHEYLENMYTMFRKVNGKKTSATHASASVTLVTASFAPLATTAKSKVVLRIKGDGKSYQFRIKDQSSAYYS